MLNRRLASIECDSCGVTNDGDPIDQIGNTAELAERVAFDPIKVKDVTYFWLCRPCSTEYPKGILDFFHESFWEEVYQCANCGGEEVESPNHWCDYCDSLRDKEGEE
jgi:hypothetical protein